MVHSDSLIAWAEEQRKRLQAIRDDADADLAALDRVLVRTQRVGQSPNHDRALVLVAHDQHVGHGGLGDSGSSRELLLTPRIRTLGPHEISNARRDVHEGRPLTTTASRVHITTDEVNIWSECYVRRLTTSEEGEQNPA